MLAVGQPHTVHPEICLSVIQCHESQRTKFILCIGVIRLLFFYYFALILISATLRLSHTILAADTCVRPTPSFLLAGSREIKNQGGESSK